MSEFKGDVGTIYTSRSEVDDDNVWEAWYEDFNIIGMGKTEIDALYDAERMTLAMNALVKRAIVEVGAAQAVSGD